MEVARQPLPGDYAGNEGDHGCGRDPPRGWRAVEQRAMAAALAGGECQKASRPPLLLNALQNASALPLQAVVGEKAVDLRVERGGHSLCHQIVRQVLVHTPASPRSSSLRSLRTALNRCTRTVASLNPSA